MPDFVTHHLFGRQILSDPELPGAIKKTVQKYPQAFAWGLQGPDLLYFHRVLLSGGEINDLGRQMHRLYTSQIFEEYVKRILIAPFGCRDILIAYFYGFICHFCVDAALHPFIYFWQGEFSALNPQLHTSGIHSYIESCIDTALYEKITGHNITSFDVSAQYTLPQPQKNAIAWVYSNLARDLFGCELPPKSIESCFDSGISLQKLFYGNHPRIVQAVSKAESWIGKAGTGTGHFKLRGSKPDWDCLNVTGNAWCDPYSKDIRYESVFTLLQNARRMAFALFGGYRRMLESGQAHFLKLPCNFCGEPI